jgi:CheY-like chemotaxis protein
MRLIGMSNANATAPAASVSIGGVLLVSNDAAAIKHLSEAMQPLAMSPEVCFEVPTALGLLNRKKFDAVIVDLQLGSQASSIVEKVRLSPSNRTAVIFAISDSDTETASAFKAGSNFVLRRPLSLPSIDRSLKVAYGLIVRERRRYFRCPVEIPATISRPAMAEIHGQTLNISEGGMAVNTSVSLAPGVKVQVHFTLPARKSRFVVDAAVCWCKEKYLGLQFSALSPQLTSELQEWLARRLEESLPQSVADRFQSVEKAPHKGDETAETSQSTESGHTLNSAMDKQDWVVLYRGALSESDPQKKLTKIELAERSMKQRWHQLAVSTPEAAKERQRLIDALENLRGWKEAAGE